MQKYGVLLLAVMERPVSRPVGVIAYHIMVLYIGDCSTVHCTSQKFSEDVT